MRAKRSKAGSAECTAAILHENLARWLEPRVVNSRSVDSGVVSCCFGYTIYRNDQRHHTRRSVAARCLQAFSPDCCSMVLLNSQPNVAKVLTLTRV